MTEFPCKRVATPLELSFIPGCQDDIGRVIFLRSVNGLNVYDEVSEEGMVL